MAKIRITKKDEQEYKRLINDAKAKIRRVKKTHHIDLSDEIKLPSLSSFSNRKEYNAFKEDLNKFNKGLKNDYKIVKNEVGASFTRKEIKEYERKEKEAIRLAEEHYEKTTPKQEKLFLKPNNLDIPRQKPWQELSRGNFEQRLENLTKRSDPQFFSDRDQRFKDNYIKSIRGSFNERDVVNEIIDMIESIPADKFYDIYDEYLDYFDFTLFDSEGQEVDADDGHLASIRLVLSSVINEERLLKDFPSRV